MKNVIIEKIEGLTKQFLCDTNSAPQNVFDIGYESYVDDIVHVFSVTGIGYGKIVGTLHPIITAYSEEDTQGSLIRDKYYDQLTSALIVLLNSTPSRRVAFDTVEGSDDCSGNVTLMDKVPNLLQEQLKKRLPDVKTNLSSLMTTMEKIKQNFVDISSPAVSDEIVEQDLIPEYPIELLKGRLDNVLSIVEDYAEQMESLLVCTEEVSINHDVFAVIDSLTNMLKQEIVFMSKFADREMLSLLLDTTHNNMKCVVEALNITSEDQIIAKLLDDNCIHMINDIVILSLITCDTFISVGSVLADSLGSDELVISNSGINLAVVSKMVTEYILTEKIILGEVGLSDN